MTFQQDFNSLLDGILTDYRNQFPEVDTAQGSLVFVKSACLASALWGLYRYQEYISRQIFPDTADTANLEHHAWLRNLQRTANETDAELLARLLDDLRRPPAGGNQYDYVKWALSRDGVDQAWCYPIWNGNGTVKVLVTIKTGFTGATVLADVAAYINTVRPVGAGNAALTVESPTVDTTNVTLSNINGADAGAIAAGITSFLNALVPGQPLYKAQLASIAISHGAVNPTVTLPAADVTTAAYHMIRPGTVTINA